MKIDSRIEPLVRAVLNGAVKSDFEQFQQALQKFRTEDDMRAGLRLAVAIAGLLLHHTHGRKPTSKEIDELAGALAREEAWSQIQADEFRDGIAAMVAGELVIGKPGSDLTATVAVPYLTAAYLLATAADPPKWWFDVLDEVEMALERQTD